MAEKKKKGFLSRIKDSLKIKKRGLSGANAELRRKRGTTQKKDVKMASFRVSNKDNRRLQSETKDARSSTVSYTKVNKKNKAQLSDQHKVKPETKSSATKTKTERVKGKGGRLLSTRTAEGRKALNKQKARKRAQEMAKKRLGK